jgi:beta-phosphoglucomutase-like phosphatase (HAD superfamily)
MADAVIFDYSGILVDSEVISKLVELNALAEISVTYKRDIYVDRYMGNYYGRFGCKGPGDFPALPLERFREEAERDLNAISGIVQAVTALKVSKAVPSASSDTWLEKALHQVGLIKSFSPHIYSAKRCRAASLRRIYT